jgi:hypothetical protein
MERSCGFDGAIPRPGDSAAEARARFYASAIELEITPEPSDDERSAIAAALALERAERPDAPHAAWRRGAPELDPLAPPDHERESSL